MSVKHRKILIGILLAAGFAAIEIPGIFFVCGRIHPFIFGLPFLYGYVLICWLYMCLVMFYGFKTSWGRHPLTVKK